MNCNAFTIAPVFGYNKPGDRISMRVNVIGSIDNYAQYNSVRIERTIEINQLVPPPASPLASPIETARIEANIAAVAPLMMAPSADGIFTVGVTSVKPPTKVSQVTSALKISSWGF